MHPEIQQGKPGKCPKCGMPLVKKKPAPVKKTSAKKSVSPTKPETDKMDRENIKSVDNQSIDVKSTTYFCPMHQEIHQDAAGKCPKCGMKLIPAKTKADSKEHNGMDMGKGSKKAGLEGLDMEDNNATMANIKKAKANLGPIKTLPNNAKPRTVRYDLYIADTTVTFGKRPKRAIAVNEQIPQGFEILQYAKIRRKG